MRIWFIGGGGFAAACLTAMSAHLQFEKIITSEPTKAGRGLNERVSAVERAVYELGLGEKLGLNEKFERTGPLRLNEKLKSAITSDPPDLAFVVDFGQLIEEPFLNGPKHGCLNIHPSLLPRWRGAAPVQRAILNGDAVTGVTVFRLVREMDAGPVLAQSEIPLPMLADASEMFQKLASDGSQIAVQSVKSIIEGSYQFSEQNSEFVTYAAKLSKEEAQISWEHDFISVHNTVRAFAASSGAFVTVMGKRLKIWRTAPVETTPDAIPAQSVQNVELGSMFSPDGGDPVVVCRNGALRLLEVQAEGKRRVSGAEWFRGVRAANC